MEIQKLAAEGAVLLSDAAFALFDKAQSAVVMELERLQVDTARDVFMLKCLLKEADEAWLVYLKASDEAMEYLL